jgi:cyclophilin family peptidyl-prolyl cis-trans isomerase
MSRMTQRWNRALENRRRTTSLGFLLVLLFAPAASADLDTVAIDTSEGLITIELFDFPDVVAHARYFRQNQGQLKNAIFHRGEKQRFCDDTYCFECTCTAGLCENDPNERTCSRDGETYWIVNDQTQPAAYLQAGRFRLDDDRALKELPDSFPIATQNCATDDLPACLPDVKPTYSNTEFTIAFVRDENTKQLTSEWIINLQDNPKLDDPFGDAPPDFADAYFVFGAVRGGQTVLSAIAANKTYDASADPSVDPTLTRTELEQFPVFDSFSGEPGSGELLIDPCDPSEPDDTVCRTPECTELASNGVACDDPRCLRLIPLTAAEADLVEDGFTVTRYCAAPALPSFPVVIPEPRTLVGQASALFGMLALVGIAAHRHGTRSRRRADSPRG